jgi:hypothetical protein
MLCSVHEAPGLHREEMQGIVGSQVLDQWGEGLDSLEGFSEKKRTGCTGQVWDFFFYIALRKKKERKKRQERMAKWSSAHIWLFLMETALVQNHTPESILPNCMVTKLKLRLEGHGRLAYFSTTVKLLRTQGDAGSEGGGGRLVEAMAGM